ncbi:MAG TPA: DNA polymerase III subunit alpha [Gemmatimonadales bacterium]|nr:DNA polymerase III subunit alpha [Gemmatimonadales bacterium]
MTRYVELHCHSGFSFLDGTTAPDELVFTAARLGYHALALTDHNGLYGSMAFAQAARQSGVQPITGAEVTLEDGAHLTLLAETQRGYANLCRLLTTAHRDAIDRHDPRLPWVKLLERQEGLIILSGCRDHGILPRALREGGVTAARRKTEEYRALFGAERFFVEVQRNSVRGDAALTQALFDLADGARLRTVATGDVHYDRRERHQLQDVLVAIRAGGTLDAAHALRRPNGEFHLAEPAEVAARFRDRPDAVAHTALIAERCAGFDLTKDLGYGFPDFRGADAPRVLREICRSKLDERYPEGSRYRDQALTRLDEELDLTDHHGLAGFFLLYHDLFELAREVAADIRAGSRRAAGTLLPGRGRGSSVSSVICYFLGLSHVDPLESGLKLGRFLNRELASIPDIDLDFPREIREELIKRVYQRYGHDHVGLVCTFPTYRLRSSVREVGKALGLPQGELEKVAKLVDLRSGETLAEEIEKLPGFAGRSTAPLWRDLLRLCREIHGLPRHVSQHVGGMIISSRPLIEIVPLERAAMPDRVVCQWDKDSCDDARFLKVDFLSLGMLSLVEECVERIAVRTGTPPDLSRIDFNDAAVYERIGTGDTVGLFQIESRAQIQMIRRTRPQNINDLAVEVAIVRPGPVVGGAVNPYVRRREALRVAEAEGRPYDPPVEHPLLREVLRDTLGVILYQDQVLEVCQALAGFTPGRAEALRRAMSRRRSSALMEGFRAEFLEGARARGVSAEVAERVFGQVTAFSEFGFPKAHAAAFGLLAYQSAWLRHYHPVEYYVALFNNQPMGFYGLDALTRDARRAGVEVRLPDLGRSDVWCAREGDAMRVGLGFVRGWHEETATKVVLEREKNGPYRSIGDFVRRAPPALRRPAIEHLVWVGGCDDFGLPRRDLIWQVGLWLEAPGTGVDSPQRRRQFELALDHPHAGLRFGDLDAGERLLAEYATLGFAPTSHPFALMRDTLPPHVVRSDRLGSMPNGARIEVAGLVVARQRPGTAKGFVFVLLEDEGGMVNVILNPDVYEQDRAVVRGERFLWVTGRLAREGPGINVLAEAVQPLALIGPRQPECSAPRPSLDLLQALRRGASDSNDWG